MSDNLIPLQTAQIRQSLDVEDNAWVVMDDKGNRIGMLPNTLDPKQAMSYLHFGRKFELGALNIGICFGAAQEHEKAEKVFQQMRNKIKCLEQQNIGLSTHLEQLIINGE